MMEAEELEEGAEEYFKKVLKAEPVCECKRCTEMRNMYESILRSK